MNGEKNDRSIPYFLFETVTPSQPQRVKQNVFLPQVKILTGEGEGGGGGGGGGPWGRRK